MIAPLTLCVCVFFGVLLVLFSLFSDKPHKTYSHKTYSFIHCITLDQLSGIYLNMRSSIACVYFFRIFFSSLLFCHPPNNHHKSTSNFALHFCFFYKRLQREATKNLSNNVFHFHFDRCVHFAHIDTFTSIKRIVSFVCFSCNSSLVFLSSVGVFFLFLFAVVRVVYILFDSVWCTHTHSYIQLEYEKEQRKNETLQPATSI